MDDIPMEEAQRSAEVSVSLFLCTRSAQFSSRQALTGSGPPIVLL